jgi:hypothetical protein
MAPKGTKRWSDYITGHSRKRQENANDRKKPIKIRETSRMYPTTGGGNEHLARLAQWRRERLETIERMGNIVGVKVSSKRS